MVVQAPTRSTYRHYQKSQKLDRLLGTFAVCGSAFVISLLCFLAIKFTIGLRATEEEEEDGLDFSEHSSNAYPDFTTE
jgi:Amt family ammonium transporter